MRWSGRRISDFITNLVGCPWVSSGGEKVSLFQNRERNETEEEAASGLWCCKALIWFWLAFLSSMCIMVATGGGWITIFTPLEPSVVLFCYCLAVVTLILLGVLHGAGYHDSPVLPHQPFLQQNGEFIQQATLYCMGSRTVMSCLASNRNKQQDHLSSFLSLSESGWNALPR